jgi:hypothetical protein
MEIKRYTAPSASQLVAKLMNLGLKQNYEHAFSLKGDVNEVLITVDSSDDFRPISGKAIWRIEVAPSKHAASIARQIWDALDWTEIAPADGSCKDLFEHIHNCGWPLIDAHKCSAVNHLDPFLKTANELEDKGWECRWIVEIDLSS